MEHMGTIELSSGTVAATVDCEGAWLTRLSDEHGDILFPKQLIETPEGTQKARGGCHVCLPNFGPGGESGLPQHGFGRLSTWKLAGQTEDSVSLMLVGGARGYETLVSTLTYLLQGDSMTVTLQLENAHPIPVRVAPGFHPYFSLQSGETEVVVNEEKLALAEVGDTLFRQGQSQKLTTARRTVNITSTNLSAWAIWSDQLGPYVCVEPTLAAYSFLDGNTAEELLIKHRNRSYTMTIRW
jgi:glucose-6-phosphate 1-epimerase